MSIDELEKQFKRLPEPAKQEVVDFIQFLEKRYGASQEAKGSNKQSNFGSAAGLIEMSDDFDEPLDDFKAYME